MSLGGLVALTLPVVVDNDVLSLTRAEQWFGTARRCDHFAVLTIGEGVGFGLVVHDEVVDRPDAGIGLLGHFRSPYASPLDVRVQPTGFPEWARGAAVTAIRTFVLGLRG